MSRYFTTLEAELTAAAGRRTRPRRSRRRMVAVTVGLVLLAGIPAIAATSVLDDDRAPDPADRLLHEEPIARGTTPAGDRWELLASEDARGFCFGVLMPTGDPRERAPGAGATCGETKPGTLTVQIVYLGGSTRTGHGPSRLLVLGTAPDSAATVEVSVRGRRAAARTIDDGKGIEGRFYVVDVPRRWLTSRRQVRALDARGKVIARAAG